MVGPLAFGHHLLCLGAQSLTRSQGREGYGSQPPRPRSLSPRQADPPPTSAALEAGAAPGRSTPRAQQGGRWARAIVTRPGQVPAQAGPPLPPPRCPPLPEQVAPLCRHPHPNLSPPGNTEERQPPRTPTGQGQGHKHALVGRFHEDTGFFSYFSFCSISCPQRASNQDLTPSLNHLCAAFSHVQRSGRRGAGRGRGGACSGRGPLGGGAGRS